MLRDARAAMAPAALLVVLLVVLRVLVPTAPPVLDRAAAALLVTAVSYALALRAGGRATLSALLALLLAAGAVVTTWPPLLGGAALGTGVVVALLGLLMTRPATSTLGTLREVGVAAALGVAGGLGVAAWHVPVQPDRYVLVGTGLALAGAVRLVHRLGVGPTGLDARSWAGTVLALVLVLAALLGPASLVAPLLALLGGFALAVGVRLRGRRRLGWWWCGFGGALTAPLAGWLLVPDPLTPLLRVAGGGLAGALVAAVLAGVADRRGAVAVRRPEPGRLHRLQ